MTLEEIKAFLEQNKDKEDVKAFVSSFNPLSGLKKEAVHDLIEKNELLKSYRDSFNTTGIETWKKNNLQKIVDEEIIKKFPPTDPEQKKLQDRLAALENENKTIKFKNTLKEIAKSFKLDESFVDFDLSDEEKAKLSFEKMSGFIENVKKTAVDEIIKGGSRNVHQPNNNNPPKEEKQTAEEFYDGMFKAN